MFEGHDQAVFDLLAERRLADAASLQAAYEEHRRSGKPFARAVLDLGLVEKPVLLRTIAEHLGGDHATDLPETLPAEAAALVVPQLARAYGVAPLAADAFSISVAAVDPFHPGLVNDLSFALERDVRVTVADPERVQTLIRQHYGEDETSLQDVLGDLQVQVRDAPAGLSETDIEEMAGQTPIIRYVNLVLAQAIRDRASDIHFEPFEHEFRIRYRLDGALLDLPPPPKALALPVISRLKVLANLNIAERRLPQDGRIRLTLSGRAVDLRVSTLPTQFGESAVLRVLDQSAVRLELAQLGMPAAVRSGVEDIIRRPNGIFIVTGPTGSGKTTTLYSCLKLLNNPESKLLTVEDPVEYEIDGIMQVPVNLAAGLTFSRALRTFLRQDPDIVMVGEIRDVETAQIAIQASLTGHLVLTTLHTNDAPSAVTRLVDMGIAPFLLASTVEAVLAQRLLRRICPECRQEHRPPEPLVRQLSAPDDMRFFRGAGCPACHHTGYRGRIGIFEFLRITDPLRDLVVKGASLVELRRQAAAEGLVSLREAALAAIRTGDTTVEEAVKYV
ncbi:MAG: GspE/PulE family protein [Verrucomicrobiota bacterium]